MVDSVTEMRRLCRVLETAGSRVPPVGATPETEEYIRQVRAAQERSRGKPHDERFRDLMATLEGILADAEERHGPEAHVTLARQFFLPPEIDDPEEPPTPARHRAAANAYARQQAARHSP